MRPCPCSLLAFLVSAIVPIFSIPANCAITTLPVGVGPLRLETKEYDLSGDGMTDLSFTNGGGVRCTDDVPTSSCSYGVSLRSSLGTEFFLATSNFAVPLRPGDVLNGSSVGGSWGTPLFSSLPVYYSQNLINPELSTFGAAINDLNVYQVGFRTLDSSGDYFYGWIDVALRAAPVEGNSEGAPATLFFYPRVLAVHFSDQSNQAVTIRRIPEPTFFSLIIASHFILFIRRR